MSEPSYFNSLPHLERLLKTFASLTATAIQLRTPNVEDDEFIRFGMIGFGQSAPLDRWELDHFQYISAIRDGLLTDDFSVQWRRFACLAAGYFLGMRVAGLLSDTDQRLAELQTPGFMWLHAESFQRTESGDHDSG